MFDAIELGSEFFEGLQAIDESIVAKAACQACPRCGGRLHRGDYVRKPRGGLLARAAESLCVRFSLCCGRDGCRRRATPPSVRFLSRRVYVGAVVIVASVMALAAVAARAAQRRTGVPLRTTRRWIRWWRGPFTTSGPFIELSSRIVPRVSRMMLPTSVLERLSGDAIARIGKLLGWLSPLTTSTFPDAPTFARGTM